MGQGINKYWIITVHFQGYKRILQDSNSDIIDRGRCWIKITEQRDFYLKVFTYLRAILSKKGINGASRTVEMQWEALCCLRLFFLIFLFIDRKSKRMWVEKLLLYMPLNMWRLPQKNFSAFKIFSILDQISL